MSFAVYLGGMALFVVMASFIGAEVTTGSLANWLTFVPHRATVLASKLHRGRSASVSWSVPLVGARDRGLVGGRDRRSTVSR